MGLTLLWSLSHRYCGARLSIDQDIEYAPLRSTITVFQDWKLWVIIVLPLRDEDACSQLKNSRFPSPFFSFAALAFEVDMPLDVAFHLLE